MYNRNEILKLLATRGNDINESNAYLKSINEPPISGPERALFYGRQVLSSIGPNTKELAAGLKTMGGAIAANFPYYYKNLQPLMREEKLRTPQLDPTFQAKAASDFDMFLSPRAVYEATVGPLGFPVSNVKPTIKGEQSYSDMFNRAGQIARTHPVDVGMTVAPGVKPVGKVLGKTSLGKSIARRSAINKALNEARQESLILTEGTIKSMPTITKQFDRLTPKEQSAIARAVMVTGETDLGSKRLNEILKSVRDTSNTISEGYHKSGLLDPGFTRDNTIATAMGNELGWKGFNHDQLMQAIKEPELLPKPMQDLYNKKAGLYDEGKLNFISQAVNPAINFDNIAIEKAGNYTKQKRILGTRTPEEMSRFIPRALDFANSRLGKYQTLSKFGERIADKGNAYKGLSNTVKDIVQQGVGKGVGSRALLNALENSDIVAKAGFTNKDLKAIASAMGVKPTKPFLNTWKAAQLISPKWVTEDLIGGLHNNLIAGVGPLEYGKALSNLDKMPELLKGTTTLSGYVGEKAGQGVRGAIADSINRMREGLSDIRYGDIGEGIKNLYMGSSDLFTRPIGRIDSTVEGLNRWANMVKQAEKKGYKLEELSDPKKFWEVHDEVVKDLGDYSSLNYYEPEWLRNLKKDVFPFGRFYGETLTRTIPHQLVEHPIGTQAYVRTPANIGKDVWTQSQEAGLYQDPEGKGGFPTGVQDERGMKVYSSGSLPWAQGLQIAKEITNPREGLDTISDLITPLFSMSDTFNMKGYKGLPAIMKGYSTGGEGTYFPMDEQGNLNFGEKGIAPLDYAKYIGKTGLGMSHGGYNFMNRVARNINAGIAQPIIQGYSFDESSLHPPYANVFNPFDVGATNLRPKQGIGQILGPLVGIKSEYLPQGPNKFEMQQEKREFKQAVKKKSKDRTITPQHENELRTLLEGYIKYNE